MTAFEKLQELAKRDVIHGIQLVHLNDGWKLKIMQNERTLEHRGYPTIEAACKIALDLLVAEARAILDIAS